MDNDINLKLRSEILKNALNLEQNVNLLLIAFLSIEKPQRKAITNKSGNLSFKNKIDLLFDLDVLNSDEHKNFLLMMEFRNQFMHNIDCCSFTDVVNLLGTDRGKKLLKFDDSDNTQDLELRYKRGFNNLYGENLRITAKKIDDRINIVEDRHKIIVNSVEVQIFFINKYFDILKKILEVFERNPYSNPEIINLFDQVNKTMMGEAVKLIKSDEFAQLRKTSEGLYTADKIKEYFKI